MTTLDSDRDDRASMPAVYKPIAGFLGGRACCLHVDSNVLQVRVADGSETDLGERSEIGFWWVSWSPKFRLFAWLVRSSLLQFDGAL